MVRHSGFISARRAPGPGPVHATIPPPLARRKSWRIALAPRLPGREHVEDLGQDGNCRDQWARATSSGPRQPRPRRCPTRAGRRATRGPVSTRITGPPELPADRLLHRTPAVGRGCDGDIPVSEIVLLVDLVGCRGAVSESRSRRASNPSLNTGRDGHPLSHRPAARGSVRCRCPKRTVRRPFLVLVEQLHRCAAVEDALDRPPEAGGGDGERGGHRDAAAVPGGGAPRAGAGRRRRGRRWCSGPPRRRVERHERRHELRARQAHFLEGAREAHAVEQAEEEHQRDPPRAHFRHEEVLDGDVAIERAISGSTTRPAPR